MAPKKTPITVTSVEVSNFHRLTFAEAKLIPGQGLIRVTGRNKSGKTALLRSIRAALGGAGEVLGSVHEGAESGSVRLTLSNGFTVGRRFTAANPKGYLTVVGPDGGEHKQGKLDEWLGPLAFDPLAFFDLKPDRQREILLSLGGDAELPSKLDGIRLRYAAKYAERTPWISQKRKAAQVDKPEGDRPQPVDVSAALARMGEIQAAQREVQDARRDEQRAREFQRRCQDQLEAARAEVQRLRTKLEEAEATVIAREAGLTVAIEGATRAGEALLNMPDPDEELERVKARIGEADTVSAAIEPWRTWDRARAEMEESVAAADAITAELEQLATEERALLEGVGIPVVGLGFSPAGEPILNGRALGMASGAERIGLSVAVALAANPSLRIALIDEANDIDMEGLAELDRLAQEHGFQLWACRLGIEGPGEIVVEDGKARSRDAEPTAVPA